MKPEQLRHIIEASNAMRAERERMPGTRAMREVQREQELQRRIANALGRGEPVPVPERRRARLVPDPAAAIEAAAETLRQKDTRRTWQNIATEIGLAIDQTVDRSTVERWAREDHIPHPR